MHAAQGEMQKRHDPLALMGAGPRNYSEPHSHGTKKAHDKLKNRHEPLRYHCLSFCS
jgi:hypothetical protein